VRSGPWFGVNVTSAGDVLEWTWRRREDGDAKRVRRQVHCAWSSLEQVKRLQYPPCQVEETMIMAVRLDC